MSRIIGIASLRGGVGKTTTTMHLATALAEMGNKVLAVDFDSQKNLAILYDEKTDQFDFVSADLFSSKMAEKYDYVLIDTEPGLSALTFAAMIIADEVMIPVVPSIWDISGLQDYEMVVSLLF